jgi:biopolymer transport protein ExbB
MSQHTLRSLTRPAVRVIGGASLAMVIVCAAPGLACAQETSGLGGTFDAKRLIEAGGAVGIVVIALSVGMVALVIEHLVTLRRNAIIPPRLAEAALKAIRGRRFAEAAQQARGSRSLLGFVLAAGLAEIENGYAAVEKAMEDACAQHAARLYRKIDYLSVIGTLSPMLGLLGTVWGMMLAFAEFSAKSNVQVSELAPGISTALVTTLFGLAVAIPAYAAFAYFRNRVDESVAACSQIAELVFHDYRRAQTARRRKLRAMKDAPRTGAPVVRPIIPAVALERERSA